MNSQFQSTRAVCGVASLVAALAGCSAAVDDGPFEESAPSDWGQEETTTGNAEAVDTDDEVELSVEPFAVFESDTLGTVSFSEPLPGDLMFSVLNENSSEPVGVAVGPVELYEQLAGEPLPERFQPLSELSAKNEAPEVVYQPGESFDAEAAPDRALLDLGWSLYEQTISEEEFERGLCSDSYGFCWLSISGSSVASGQSTWILAYVHTFRGAVTHKFKVKFLTESGPWVTMRSQTVPAGYTSSLAYLTNKKKWKRSAVSSFLGNGYHHAGYFQPIY